MPHYTAGFFQLNLHKELPQTHYVPDPSRPTIDHTDTTSFPESTTDNVLRRNEKIIIAHGVIASLGFLVLLPAGSLVARWARALTPKWFKAHQAFMLIAMPVITVGWVLGPIAVMARQATHLFDAHQVSGSFKSTLFFRYTKQREDLWCHTCGYVLFSGFPWTLYSQATVTNDAQRFSPPTVKYTPRCIRHHYHHSSILPGKMANSW